MDDRRLVLASGSVFLAGSGISGFLGDAFLFHVQFCLCCLNRVSRSLAECMLKELDLKTACTSVCEKSGNSFARLTKATSGPVSYTHLDVYKRQVPVNSVYFWAYYFPFKLVKYILGLIVLLALLFVSFFPLVGPILFHILISPFIAQIYFSKVLRLQKFNNLQRRENFYLHAGQYASFGLLAGLIESVPVLAGFAISTNTIGSVLLNIDYPMIPETVTVVETNIEIETVPQATNEQVNQ